MVQACENGCFPRVFVCVQDGEAPASAQPPRVEEAAQVVEDTIEEEEEEEEEEERRRRMMISRRIRHWTRKITDTEKSTGSCRSG